MNRPRVLAALVVLFLLLGAAGLAYSLDPAGEAQAYVLEPLSPTTEEPDFEALVESGFVDALVEEEAELTDQAVERATSTTSSLPPSTTEVTTNKKKRAAKRSSPPRTSPPQTSPPQTSPPTTAAASEGGYSSGAESEFASKINSFRSSNGEPGLKRSGSLDSYARSWAKKMAQNGGISHSSIGSLLGTWTAVAENVGMGGSVGSIFDALKSSSGHRANMLGEYTHMGVGVWRDGDGALWTAHVFAR